MGKKRRDPEDAEFRFDTYYRTLFGDRWQDLRDALLRERQPVAFADHLTEPYFMDEASVEAAHMLGVKNGDCVLDMCAAPGGKTLVLASHLEGTGHLTANDRSSARRARLRTVIETHVPVAWRASIDVTGHDASRWGLYERDAYDRILLDAPCSSERHVVADAKALSQWSEKRSYRLSVQQFAMLAAALDAVRIGGYIVYSTCALLPAENECVVEKLMQRRQGRCEIIPAEMPYAEKCRCGSVVMPDTARGRGPLYSVLIRRIA